MMKEKTYQSDKRVIILVMTVFLALGFYGILNHEIWLDEAQHFLIARDSNSIGELFTNMKYDGHVQLWNYLLYFITHYLSTDPLAMQVFNLVIINFAVFILLRFAPFPLYFKLGIIFGYYFLFEYSLVSRNYSLGILFLFSCCALLKNPQKNIYAVASLCFLMINTHLFFLFAALGILSFYVIQSFQLKEFRPGMVFMMVLTALGLFLAFIQIEQIPSDNTYFHPGQLAFSISSLVHPFYSIGRGFFPLQDPVAGHFWNSYFFDQLPVIFKILLALMAALFPLLILYRNKKAFVFYLVSAGLLSCFLFISQMLGNRYFGMFYIFFISASWLAALEKPDLFSFSSGPFAVLVPSVLGLVISVQILAGVFAYITDMSRPFSLARETIDYIRNNANGSEVVVSGYGSGPSLSAYFGKPLYYLDISQKGSYCIWKEQYFKTKSSIPESIDQSSYLKGLGSFILVSNKPAIINKKQSESCSFEIREMSSFTGGILQPDYYVYRVTKNNYGIEAASHTRF